MTAIIYLISVDKIPRYVGSSRLGDAFDRRKKNHLTTKPWLKNVPENTIVFDVLDECEEDKRYELEHFYWSILVSEGFLLENRRDPINAWPLHDRKEAARIGVETRRRNGTLSNGIKAVLESGSPWKKEVLKKGAETRKRNGTDGNGGKVSGRRNFKLGNSKSAREKAVKTRIERGNIHKSGQSNKGKKRPKISEALKGKKRSEKAKLNSSKAQSARYEINRKIAEKFGISVKEAEKLRMKGLLIEE